MKSWRDLSYRHKVPLALSIVILTTALIVSIVLLAHAWHDAREQFVNNGSSLGRVLARSLTAPLLHDDPWGAFEILRTPLEEGETRRVFVVLDRTGRVFAASDPVHFRVLTPLSELSLFAPFLTGGGVAEHGDWLLLEQPVRAEDGVVVGRLLIAYHKDLARPRFEAAARRVLLGIAAALLVLLPMGWYAGNALAVPLLRLANCFQLAGRRVLSPEECRLDDGQDEIGLVGRRFKEMLAELEEKHRLESQMIATQRLAAIGRLTAGIAHEVNNPLGGMLNAISTYRRHGGGDPLAERTFDLIERGLKQIGETVGALLVEARLESHALRPEDLEDIRTLIQAEVQHRHLTLDWRVDLPAAVPLPATPVRQILLNLLLNACQAAERRVELEARMEDSMLTLTVANDGRPIPPRRMEHLYEPFVEEEGEGRGLGLWIVYQLTRQLQGQIQVASQAGDTRFILQLPVEASR